MRLHPYQKLGTVLTALLPLAGAQAQPRPQLSLSVGPAYSVTTMQRTAGTPTAFRADNTFGPAGELRLAWPLNPQWALESMLGLNELQPGIQYRQRNSRGSAGIGIGPLLQTGVVLRRLDLLTLGARLSLDATLGAGITWRARPYPIDRLSDFNPGQRQPGSGRPMLVYASSQPHRSTWLLNGGVRLRYALTPNHNLLLSLDYSQGLRPLVESRTRQLTYLDANGKPQQGDFVLRDRGSRAALQVGYGWVMGRAGERPTAHTPRYGGASRLPEEPAEDQEPTFSEPPIE